MTAKIDFSCQKFIMHEILQRALVADNFRLSELFMGYRLLDGLMEKLGSLCR